MKPKLLSLAEITALEAAYAVGGRTLGVAADALLARWRDNIRDQETFVRLAFLLWYSENEPAFLTGLDEPLPTLETLIAEQGGDDALWAEALFVVGFLWSIFPPLGGDGERYGQRARLLAERAATLEPTSLLFQEWPFLFNDAPDTVGVRMWVEREVHARFDGRGAMGDYIGHQLRGALEAGRNQRA